MKRVVEEGRDAENGNEWLFPISFLKPKREGTEAYCDI